MRKVTRALCLASLLNCGIACKPSVVYLKGGEYVQYVAPGETLSVPGPAWVTTDEGMAGYYDYLEDKVREKEREPD